MSETKKYAFVENGVVKNIIVATSEYALENDLIECDESVNIFDSYENGSFIPYSPNNSETWDSIIKKRDELIEECSIYWQPEVISNLTKEERDNWGRYRQDLYNITETYNSPSEVVWPTKPTN